MKNTFGASIAVTLFGESHGPAVGAVLDGLAPGIAVDPEMIARQLSLRRPAGKISTKRVEQDDFQIVSGVFRGKTTGTPLCILIPNTAQKSGDYEPTEALARPGHADLTAYYKYHGFEDDRGGGHFSGRITAALAAAGAVLLPALKKKKILIGTHIKRCAGIDDDDFSDYTAQIRSLGEMPFAVLNEEKGKEMIRAIEAAAEKKDSVGGILETAVIGCPVGVGEPWFDTLEGVLAHALFSIPAIKGVEFGAGFGFADLAGSAANDPIRTRDSKIYTVTNHNGGINGGISNGMPILFRCAVKPTPSIFRPQDTVDLKKNENATIEISGRHDPAIIHRARVVADSITALVLSDLLAQRFGTDWLGGED